MPDLNELPTCPALPAIASFCTSARNRFPAPPDWLLDDPVTVSTHHEIEDVVEFLHTGITLAARVAFDGNTALSTTGEALTCDDMVEALIYWTRVAIHALECSDPDDVGDVADLIDELNTVVNVLVSNVDAVRDQGGVASDLSASWTTLDLLRRRIEMR